MHAASMVQQRVALAKKEAELRSSLNQKFQSEYAEALTMMTEAVKEKDRKMQEAKQLRQDLLTAKQDATVLEVMMSEYGAMAMGTQYTQDRTYKEYHDQEMWVYAQKQLELREEIQRCEQVQQDLMEDGWQNVTESTSGFESQTSQSFKPEPASRSIAEENSEQDQMSDDGQIFWVQLSGDGNCKEKVKALQGSECFAVEKFVVQEKGARFGVQVEELEEGDQCMVAVAQTRKGIMEDFCEDVEETALPKKRRNQLRKSFQQMRSEAESISEVLGVAVSEVYSPPRLTVKAQRAGSQEWKRL